MQKYASNRRNSPWPQGLPLVRWQRSKLCANIPMHLRQHNSMRNQTVCIAAWCIVTHSVINVMFEGALFCITTCNRFSMSTVSGCGGIQADARALLPHASSSPKRALCFQCLLRSVRLLALHTGRQHMLKCCRTACNSVTLNPISSKCMCARLAPSLSAFMNI